MDVRARLVRVGEALRGGFRIGDRLVEPAQCRIASPGSAIHVEPRAMGVLVALAERAGEMVSRDELIRAVWKHPHVTDEALTRCVSLLRKALGDDRDRPQFLETIPKRGYRLLQPVMAMHSAFRTGDEPISLAVLPILNLSGDPADEYLADATTKLLIANLARLSGLHVISCMSSMHYKGTPLRVTEVARELGVTRIVEGSMLRSASELHVVILLIDPATGAHLLSRRYTREFVDLLQVRNEVAWTIVGEIGATLRPDELEQCPMARANAAVADTYITMSLLEVRHRSLCSFALAGCRNARFPCSLPVPKP